MTRAEMTAFVNQTITGAVKAHMGRLDFKGMITEAMKGVIPAGDAGGGNEPPAPPAGDSKTKGDPRVALLERQIAEMRAASEAKDKAAEQRMRDASMRDAEAQLRTALAGKVRPEALDLAVNDLKARGAIQLTEDGGATLRLPVAVAGSKPEPVDFDFASGVAEYLKSPSAAVMLPAPTGGGSGSPRQVNASGRQPAFNTQKPLSQWTESERNAFHQQRLTELQDAHNKNPLG